MDIAFCYMEHDDVVRKDLFQVMDAFSKVTDSDSKTEGAFTERDMNRSQQSWVKTFIQDVMDEKGHVLFDNLTWFVKKLCSVMTSSST